MKPDRPMLRLKKPTPAPTAPAVTVKPAPAVAVKPEKPTKPAKPIPEKERMRLENIRLNAEACDRRKAQIERAKPLIDAYIADKLVLRETVLIDGVECFRPLMIGTRKTIFAFLKAHPDLQDCTNTVLNDLISEVLEAHVAKLQYIAGLVKFNERFDLDGNPVDAILEKHKAAAIKVQKAKD